MIGAALLARLAISLKDDGEDGPTREDLEILEDKIDAIGGRSKKKKKKLTSVTDEAEEEEAEEEEAEEEEAEEEEAEEEENDE